MKPLEFLKKEVLSMVSDLECIEVRRGSGIGMLFLGVGIGAIAGGLAALLLTPRSGKETQDILKGRAKQTGQMLQSRLSDVKEKFGQMGQNMRSSAESRMQSVEQSK
jgi:gas vesicle protein